MKKILLSIALMALVCGLVGCEDNTEKKAKQLKFENRSTHVIHIVSLSTEWQGFLLHPGQIVVLEQIRIVDWYFSRPSDSKVQEAISSKERHVIFVNAEPQSG